MVLAPNTLSLRDAILEQVRQDKYDQDELLDSLMGTVSVLGDTVDGKAEASDVTALDTTTTGQQAQINALLEMVDTLANPPTGTPAVPGLFAHWDATQIVAVDQSRISSWADETTGKNAAQATSSKQPLYDITGMTGKPGVYFDKAREDSLIATGLSPTSNHSTLFVVALAEARTGLSGYLFGMNNHGKNLYHRTAGSGFGIQGQSTALSANYNGDGVPNILTGVFNDASSAIRVNTIQTTGSVGTQTSLPTSISLGHRITEAAGNGFTGYLGEVLYYDRVLTGNEIDAVEAYLAAKWQIPITPQVVWYVDSVTGADGNYGRLPSGAKATISAAVEAAKIAGAADATIIVHAPEATPIRETATINVNGGGTVRIVSRTPRESWHAYGSARQTDGWTHVDGGVYSKAMAISVTTNPVAFVTTLLDLNGQPTRVFTRNTATPTTPAAGEYGYDSGTYYLHLPGNANPNLYKVEIAHAANLFQILNDTLLTIDDGRLYGAQTSLVRAGSSAGVTAGAGEVIANRTKAYFAGDSPWATSQYVTGMRCRESGGFYGGNDGFNHHCVDGFNSPLMELIDCEGAWNADEGVSPHETTRMNLRGGRFHHNGNAGFASVGSAITQISGTEFDHNWQTLPASNGGVSVLELSMLISRDLYSHDHPVPGVHVAATATWTDNGGTRSGIGNGNVGDDEHAA